MALAVTAQEGKKAPRFFWHGSSQSFVTSVDALQFYKLRSLQA